MYAFLNLDHRMLHLEDVRNVVQPLYQVDQIFFWYDPSINLASFLHCSSSKVTDLSISNFLHELHSLHQLQAFTNEMLKKTTK